MTVIRPNAIAGITSLTAQTDNITFHKSDGTTAGLLLSGVNFNTTSGVSTFATVNATLFTGDGSGLTGVASTDNIVTDTVAQFNGDISIASSIFHVGNTDTSIRFPANNAFTINTNGSERLRVDSAGEIGINTTDPKAKLDIVSDGNFTLDGDTFDGVSVIIRNAGGTQGNDQYGSAIGFSQIGNNTVAGYRAAIAAVQTGGDTDQLGLAFFTHPSATGSNPLVESFRITASGNVGIGTDDPLNKLHVFGSGHQIKIEDAAGSSAQIQLDGTNSNFNLDWVSASDRKINLINSGSGGVSVGIAITTPTSRLHVDGDVLVTGVGTAIQWDATSDITLKENIEIIDEPIVKLSQLKGVTFDWKAGGHSVGVIAQDVEKVLPTAVGGSKDQKTVNYNAIIGLLVESVKDQQKQIEELKSLLDK